jgi:hypothetical protein
MQNLGANPSGGIAGQPNQTSDADALGIVNRIKDREMQDFQSKATFMSDLSLRQQQRMAAMFPPEKHNEGTGQVQPNVAMAKDSNQMTGYEKGELGVRQQGMNLESQKMAQSGKLGQEALDIKTQQEKVNQTKSDQINATKQADMQRKIDESNQKIQLATDALRQKTDNAEAQLKLHENLAKAVEERHKLEMANMQNKFDITSGQHQQTIDSLNERIKQTGNTHQVKKDAAGNVITTDTQKGSAADTIRVTGPNGEKGTVNANETLPSGWSKIPDGGDQ